MRENASKFERKTRSKFMATTPGFSTVEIARLEIAFSESFKLEGSPVEGQSVQQNDTKMKKKKRKKKERLKRKQIKYRNACGKKGMLSCCKYLFESIETKFSPCPG